MTRNNDATIRGTSLRRKALSPFIVILLALGTAATLGTILIITSTLEKTADERLSAFQQQIYREMRELEARLLRRTNLLEVSFHIDRMFQDDNSSRGHEIGRLIDESLVSEGITARYISPRAHETFPEEKLSRLIDLARISGKAQIRFTTDIGPHPALTVIRPLLVDGEIVQYIFIQASMGAEFLERISAPLNIRTALFDLNGKFLVGSVDDHPFASPSPDTLARTLDGQNVFVSRERMFSQRNLFYAVPLGTTDMLIVLLEMPLADISDIISTLTVRSAISILVAMLIGGLIYYRLISQILAPAQSMMLATKAIGDGNLGHRIENIPSGEFGQLASSFNEMMQNISSLYDEKIVNERELTKAQEELKYKDILEEKNRVIENANQELKAHLRELTTLLQLNQAMASTLDLDLLFDRVIHSLSELLDCHMVSLMLYDAGNEALVVSHTLGIDKEKLEDVIISLNEGISGEAARTHNPIYVRNVREESRFLNYKGAVQAEGSLLSIPLLSKNRLCGVLNLHTRTVDGFDEDDIKLAQAISNQVAVSIENARLYEKAKAQSITDELTGLANRRHFQDIFQREIVHAQRYSSNISMIIADIDHFKRYNDTHGHIQGDVALKQVADTLLQNTRGIDLVARFGGEEFVILLPKTGVAGARITAEKLRQKIMEEQFAGEDESQPDGTLTLSLGVASYPDHTPDMSKLLERADQALYRAKGNGRNRVVVWDEEPA